MNYLDANFATALYFNIRGQTEAAGGFVRKSSEPFVFSALAELECRRAFIMQTGHANSENWMRLQAALDSGVWRRENVEWDLLREKSQELIDRFGPTLKTGTLDTLHVAHALSLGCRRFLSFDTASNARTLAAGCRLKVYPELTLAEKSKAHKDARI